MSKATLTRQVFTVERWLDFFNEGGLTKQIGYERRLWPAAVLKELIDNALDACEREAIAPKIKITLKPDSLTVIDNGPGLAESTITASLDYELRVSDKVNYISPTRGQLGNALKCLWAVPYVCSEGHHGVVEVDSLGVHFKVEVRGSDADPQIVPTKTESSVKKGTSIKVHWPGLASSILESGKLDFYNVALQFACLNPHATFQLHQPDVEPVIFPESTENWKKWRTDQPTSSHWYSPESFHNLVAAYLRNRQAGKSVREFVAEFDGLRGSQYQRQIMETAKVAGTLGDLTETTTTRLLDAMKAATREVKPQRLGIIGADHFRKTLLALGISKGGFAYKKKLGTEDGLPFVVEAAFGSKRKSSDVRDLLLGLNFSPTFRVPSQQFENALDAASVYDDDPAVVAVHLVTPHLQFTTLGKGEITDESPAIWEALSNTIAFVTRRYTRKKQQARRHNSRRLRQETLDEHNQERNEQRSKKDEIKAAAYSVMEQSYLMASGERSLPAKPRQIMYVARPLVIEITGGKCWAKSSYFTQTLLPNYRDEHPDQTREWNIVYDARGHFREPHTGVNFEIGTSEVRDYLEAWKTGSVSRHGPANRFKNALFIEKEGFDELLDASGIAERFDISILSTKGMSTTSARELIEGLDQAGVRTFVAHDFDLSGFGIFYTLGHDTRRHEFETLPNVIDIGLRLTDVREMALQDEPYQVEQGKDPKEKLIEYGATEEELEFLIGEKRATWWDAKRVELNAMTSPQLVAWLERKLLAHGVEKVVPDFETLGPIWQERERVAAFENFKNTNGDRVLEIEKHLEEAKSQLETDFIGQYEPPQTPTDLQERVRAYLQNNRLDPWDVAIKRLPLSIT